MLISSRPSDSIKKISPWAALTRWTYADLYLGTAAMLREYQRVRPHFLYGPMSPLLLLAQALAQSGGGHHRPLGVISTGEQLSPSNCRHLESVFGGNVTDFYGMTEVGLIASRSIGCSTYQIIKKGAFFFEYIPMPDLPGFERLVVTDLQGGSMPLIRYETGDLVRRDIFQPGKPIIEFAGKQIDFVWLLDGERVSPYLIDGAVGDLPGVTQYKVIQQLDRSMDVYIATQVEDAAVLWEQAKAALSSVCRGLDIRMHALDELPATVGHKSRPIQTRVSLTG
jgi:phenylacetate-coenzyme A ligase PaaK-like adenylate-forming protein